ncbi:NUDIX hydrolase [Candidatus Parcubacteria bacterium]|nr:NUDIX hydrolase [Patescibacteria group bacterium]MBU4309013.1 NUDIX hydrolase [Patescibacteria group bacterium]MBU4432393.1 NUDIX hydrolase [Patescibacteria group bacterium]MBU4577373.1 NUDIX hydrolase [Patescibacteria group bacterium]MCG2697061.1 NUDIX hydrolase [Candidatus Parcubacteria bacterium]
MKQVHPAVKAIIQRGDKFLVIKQEFNDKAVWDLPGGRVEFGESPYDTLVREIDEEVHLSINIIKPLGFFWFFRHDGDQVVCTTFLCTADDYEIDLTKNPADENITEYKWVTKDEFLGDEYVVMHESMKKLVTLL